MDTFECILSRRTHKQFTGEPVTKAQLEQLLELGIWAPNHRLTEPWRFFVVQGDGIPGLTQAVLDSIGDDEHPKLLKKKAVFARRLPKLGAFISVVRTPVPDDPMTDLEDHAACSCAVQNIMLGATAMGLASFWSTGKVFNRPPVRAFLGLPEGVVSVASIWLGFAEQAPHSKRIPVAELTTWIK